MTIKTIFLDRDGVINKEKNYLNQIQDFEFIEGVFESCRYFTKKGFRIIIITNQSGISRGYYTKDDYETLTKWMLNKFKSQRINILDVFHCPHSPGDSCECRKPLPGMFIKAQEKYNIDMTKSWSIGDKEDDIIAANLSGIKNTILVQSGHKIITEQSKASYLLKSIKDSIKII
jgi:D-glycero-D-manno-heptose 1,7-bisphosphate phosphatase